MFDFVVNYIFDQYVWFKEFCFGKSNFKCDWYIWCFVKYVVDGFCLLLNNWRCNFGGGSVWEWDEELQEYYLYLFCKEQFDFNWENFVI